MIPLYDRNPTATFPFITLAIIAANVGAFAYQFSLPPRAAEQLVYALGVVPAAWTGSANFEPGMLTFVTCMFLHGGLMHLFGNMLYLWIFGNNIEDALGHFKFLVFYLVTGIVGSLMHLAFNLGSTLPIIGASGAISGVLGAYFLYYPRARVVGMVIIIPFLWMPRFEVSAFFFLAFYIVMQLARGMMEQGAGGGVAWWAHIGGFGAGFLLAAVLTRRR